MRDALQGRVSIVTGSSRGVGRACAIALARAGSHVVLAAKSVRPHERLPGTIHSVAEEIKSAAPDVTVLPVACNVRKEEDIQAVVDRTLNEFDRIDVVVNNAGAAWWFPVSETPSKRFDLVMDVNFRAAHILSRAVLPTMMKARFGHIVNMSPPLIRPAMVVDRCAYMVSKFGMTYLSLAIAEEHRKDNIASHALWPVTLIESAATRNLGLGSIEQWRKPEILADATVALCSQDPTRVSGRAWMDEEVLGELEGVTDFSGYACVPGTSPARIPW